MSKIRILEKVYKNNRDNRGDNNVVTDEEKDKPG